MTNEIPQNSYSTPVVKITCEEVYFSKIAGWRISHEHF